MPNTALALIPSAVTLVTTLVLAFFGPPLRLMRTTRRQLAQDAEYVGALLPQARAHLERDMAARALRLVAFSRYPSITLPELMGGFAVFAIGPGLFAFTYLTKPSTSKYFDFETYFNVPLYLLASTGIWLVLWRSWAARAARRFEWMDERLDDDVVAEQARITVLGAVSVKVVAILSLFGTGALAMVLLINEPPSLNKFETGQAVIGWVIWAVLAIGFWRSFRWKALDRWMPRFPRPFSLGYDQHPDDEEVRDRPA